MTLHDSDSSERDFDVQMIATATPGRARRDEMNAGITSLSSDYFNCEAKLAVAAEWVFISRDE